MRALLFAAMALLAGCGRYADFTLPPAAGSIASINFQWQPRPAPVIERGPSGAWDAHDVLNPSVVQYRGAFLNLYSGFDGKTWHTGLAASADGISWHKEGRALSPNPSTWEGDYIAANGSVIAQRDKLLYFYQGGRAPRIGLATSPEGRTWQRHGDPVLGFGPRGSWDERGVADPYVISAGGKLYLFYLGQDRARRQRLGVAVSGDGVVWTKLRSNPILEPGGYGDFDENGIGEPAVWAASGYYWMLYTGRDHNEARRLGMARSRDGVHWEKLDKVFGGDQAWDRKVLCDPTVLPASDGVRVWFGGGDVARPDENLDGQIGYALLKP
jgi:predicted GH43/DUF377 family glycosyl hydrolase